MIANNGISQQSVCTCDRFDVLVRVVWFVLLQPRIEQAHFHIVLRECTRSQYAVLRLHARLVNIHKCLPLFSKEIKKELMIRTTKNKPKNTSL